MKNMVSKSVIIVMVAMLITVPFGSPALAQEYFESEEPGGGAMTYDLVVVRPLGIIATLAGSVIFVVSLPFSLLGDNVDTAGEKLVKAPARFTFKRPLGEF
jgi:hypothetical protein